MTMRKTALAALLAATSLGFAATASAADCAITVETGDMLKFEQDVIAIDSQCKEFTVKLVHEGKLPKNVMGHNWVLSKAADVSAIASEGIKAGLEQQYVKQDDARVLAYTKVIGGGEETSVTFGTDKLSPQQEYVFFCSFPGHSTVMRGTLALKAAQ